MVEIAIVVLRRFSAASAELLGHPVVQRHLAATPAAAGTVADGG